MATDLLLPRCSPAVRSLGNLPIGTAATRTSFLLVDVALPWGKDIGDDPALAPVLEAIGRAAARGERWRLQGTVPIEGSRRHRVVGHRLPEGGFDRYRRRAVEVAVGDAVEAAVALLDDPTPWDDDGAESGTTDLLVCTHGRRDTCCGGSGTTLWRELLLRPDVLGSTTALARTSHTGGHRFAPTAIHLPSGTCWAWLDVDAVDVVLRRSAPWAAVADRYRGSCALATPAEQVVEAAVLAEVGWSWLDGRRTGAAEPRDGGGWSVALRHEASDGANGTWRAEVEVTGRAPVPDCGGPLDDAPKHEDLLAVVAGSLRHERG